MKRQASTGDIVLKCKSSGPSDTAPALKKFFYPGRLSGQEFVYSDEEARAIAARTETLVLSTDEKG